MERGLFRADLYYRINQFAVSVPPLHERSDDIPLLVQTMLSRLAVQLDRPVRDLSPEFHAKLRRHRWPGNVRELQQVITTAAVLEEGTVLQGHHFRPDDVGVPAPVPSLGPVPDVRSHRRELVRRALADAAGNKSAAAATLGISRKTLYAWLVADGRAPAT